ncbi:hypothetical protein BOO69_02975 [Sulfitobacter alexandrii]|uniref:IclR family transcriptional regulator n=1 Tax=Sulfitobacter alexandrii TaxID=1917485 RepID=A0A1J0WDW1_9RHOB|nr:IclR family transcriptional regulator [Sulfitobacter alexandrii]APE42491.1 hypothetical protein BOO69_02975 [Sulfitobacter alexandrii]
MAHDIPDRSNDRQFVTSLARGLTLLAAFGPDDRSLTNQMLADRTALPRPTVARLAHTLVQLNYLVHHKALGRYSLSPRLVALGQAAHHATGLRDIARPAIAALSEIGDISVALGTPDDGTIKYVDLARRPEAIVLNLNVGAQVPIAQTAIGRAYLGWLQPEVRGALIERLSAQDPSLWAQHARAIDHAAEDLRTLGYVSAFGDWFPELNAIATVIRIADGAEPLLISVSGLSSILTPARAASYFAPALLNTARNIEARMRSLPHA